MIVVCNIPHVFDPMVLNIIAKYTVPAGIFALLPPFGHMNLSNEVLMLCQLLSLLVIVTS